MVTGTDRPVPIRDWRGGGSAGFTEEERSGSTDEVRNAAYRVIRGKRATSQHKPRRAVRPGR